MILERVVFGDGALIYLRPLYLNNLTILKSLNEATANNTV